MFFTIKINGQAKYQKLSDLMIKTHALQSIAHYKLGPGEKALDKYLLNHYKKDLKYWCVELILKSKIYRNGTNDDLVVLFPTRDLDKIASIITYGIGPIFGSRILAKAFDRVL